MDDAQRVLYGKFPRDGCTPKRFPLFSEDHFDEFVNSANGQYNLYCSLAQMHPIHGPIHDKVSMDFDTPYKVDKRFTHPRVEPDELHPLVFASMRSDEGLARDILGRPLRDAQEFTKASIEEGIPVMGVFTGFGLHVHTFYKPMYSPEKEMYSTANRHYVERNLSTSDTVIFGDTERILKIPNTMRVERREDRVFPCKVWTVPLTKEEILEADPVWLLEQAQAPRQIEIDEEILDVDNRPDMQYFEEYSRENTSIDSDASYEKEIQPKKLVSYTPPEDCEWLIRQVIPMPCMQEHLFQPNPDHKIRQNFAVMMYNAGYTPDEVHAIIEKMGWRDYDRKHTRYQLKQIWKGKYVDMSCNSMWMEGYCVHSEDTKGCPTYKWRGGNCEY